jgi:acyl-coenzyme A synthetase/AMP-(fatty) acid ligase/acyl carrier protein
VMLCHGRRQKQSTDEASGDRLTEEDRHILKSSISFTLLIREIFWPLLSGAELIIAPAGIEQDSAALVNFIARHRITVITVTPTLLAAFLEDSRLAECRDLRHVTCYGEPLPAQVRERFFACLSAELSVYYGATEAPSAAMWKCTPGRDETGAALGDPLPGIDLRLLDPELQPVPAGACGELYIGGKLARGYFGRPELTAERFIPHPFSVEPGARLYRTGDLGRSLLNGGVEYLGRVDDQVKIRGFRIEPIEIENTLLQHPAIGEAKVLGREDSAGNKRLMGYVAFKSRSVAVTVGELRNFLNARLPQYMVPSGFVFLDRLPKTPSGKVDAKSLPRRDASRPILDTPFVAPRTSLEEEVAAIWKEILGLDSIGVEDRFLELGGDSLQASQIISRVLARFQLRLSVQVLFDAPTVAQMAAAIDQDEATRHHEDTLGNVLAEVESIPEEEANQFLTSKDLAPAKKSGD